MISKGTLEQCGHQDSSPASMMGGAQESWVKYCISISFLFHLQRMRQNHPFHSFMVDYAIMKPLGYF